MEDVVITSERLSLRSLDPKDCGEVYVAWLANPEINQWLETRWVDQDIASVRSFVESMNADPDTALLGIHLDDVHIGNIKLGPIDRRHLCADVSYFIGERQAWGRGYATEAIRAVVGWGFESCGLHRVQAGAYAGNIGSARALEKVGFTKEGVWRQQLLCADGSRQDHCWFGILHTDWSE